MDCGNREAQEYVDEDWPKETEGTVKPPPVGIIEVLDVSLRTDSGAESRSIGELRASICLGNAMRMELLEHESNTWEKIYEGN